VTAGDVPLTDLRTQQDNFASAQFEDLSDQDNYRSLVYKTGCGLLCRECVARAAKHRARRARLLHDYFEPAAGLTIYVMSSFPAKGIDRDRTECTGAVADDRCPEVRPAAKMRLGGCDE